MSPLSQLLHLIEILTQIIKRNTWSLQNPHVECSAFMKSLLKVALGNVNGRDAKKPFILIQSVPSGIHQTALKTIKDALLKAPREATNNQEFFLFTFSFA